MAERHVEQNTTPSPRARQPMEEDEISRWLKNKIENALNNSDDDISETRQRVLDYYRGRPYGDEQPQYSKVITHEVFEAVEWTLPGLVRTFTTTDPVVFVPNNGDDIDAAEQETEVVNHVIKTQTNHYDWVHTWCKDTLLQPNGYLKVSVDEARDLRRVVHEGMTEAQLALIQQDPNLFSGTVEEAGTLAMPVTDPQTGMPTLQQVPLFNVTARYREPGTRITIEAVPPEEVLVDNNLNCVDLDEADFVCHHREVSRSELVSMGYDKEYVWSLPSTSKNRFSTERERRRRYEAEDPHFGEDKGAHVKLDLYECYAYLDVDDDGYAEFYRFLFVGEATLLEFEEYDYQPMIALGCYPQPHRHTAISMGEMAMENQRTSSVLKRQTLDNLYRVNRPRQFAGRGVNTGQLMNYVPHGVVEMDDVRQVAPEVVPIAIDKVLPFLDWHREELERVTGASRHAAGLDAQAMASSTMGAYLTSLGQSTQRQEMLVRNFAETGFAKVARKVHHLLRTRSDAQMTVNLRGEWVDVDPRTWDVRERMEVRVGIGTGTPQEKLAGAMQMLEVQDMVGERGLTDNEGAWHTLKDIVEALGKTAPERYFVDPSSAKFKQWQQNQQQNAERARADAQKPTEALLEIEAAKERNRQAETTAKTLLDADKNQGDQYLKAADLELKHGVDLAKVGIEEDKIRRLNVPGSRSAS